MLNLNAFCILLTEAARALYSCCEDAGDAWVHHSATAYRLADMRTCTWHCNGIHNLLLQLSDIPVLNFEHTILCQSRQLVSRSHAC